MSEPNDKPKSEVSGINVNDASEELPFLIRHLKEQSMVKERIQDINELARLQSIPEKDITDEQRTQLAALREKIAQNSQSKNGIGFGDGDKNPQGHSR
jgi:hypothetical protein